MASASESNRVFSLFAEQATKLEAALGDKKDLDLARSLIQEMRTMVTAHAAALPARDVQTYGARIDAFRKRLDELKEPKKRFAFSKTTKVAHAEKVQEQDDKTDQSKTAQAGEATGGAAGDPPKSVTAATFTIENKHKEKVELEGAHGDVELRNIVKSRILIRGCPNTLYINDIEDSEVICEPVASSVLIVGFRASSLHVACQQLRIHKAVEATFRLHITSRSIIEDCRGVVFGPLPEDYPASEDSWTRSGLNRSKNNFAEVDDFDWLNTSQPSPNWKLLD